MEYYKEENTRLKEELPTFTRVMAASVAPGFIACNNAKLKTFGQDNYGQERDAYRAAVCSGIQADKIFQQGSASSPILIPAEYHSRPTHSLSIPTYLEFLSSKTAIDIHQFGPSPSQDKLSYLSPTVGRKHLSCLPRKSFTYPSFH